ncbi:MAG: hypothetical protein ACTHMG_13510 [Sphingomonas sp.]
MQRLLRRLGVALVVVALLPALGSRTEVERAADATRADASMLAPCLAGDPAMVPGCVDGAPGAPAHAEVGTVRPA